MMRVLEQPVFYKLLRKIESAKSRKKLEQYEEQANEFSYTWFRARLHEALTQKSLDLPHESYKPYND